MEGGVPVHIDPTINVGNLVSTLLMLVAFGVWAFKAGGDFSVLKAQVQEIIVKLDTFISKEMVEQKEIAAKREHEFLQEQIDDLKRLLKVIP